MSNSPAPAWAPSPGGVTVRPKAPGATLSLVLGIVSLAGLFILVAPVFLAPLACYHAVAARRRIAREPDRWSGGGQAQAGLVMALIASALILVLLALLLLAGVGTLVVSTYDAGYGT